MSRTTREGVQRLHAKALRVLKELAAVDETKLSAERRKTLREDIAMIEKIARGTKASRFEEFRALARILSRPGTHARPPSPSRSRRSRSNKT